MSGGRRALVTGAARGLGAATSARLIADGWSVALLDVSETIHGTAARLAETGGTAFGVVSDVSDAGQVEHAVAEAADRLTGLDLLVNNAAIGGPTTDLVDTSTEELRRVIEVDLLGAMFVARACARRMVAGGTGGAIVNLGSIFGQRGVAGGAAYCAAKGGIALLTHSLALELASHGIRVNTIAPGNMATEMHWADLRAQAEEQGRPFEEIVEEVRRSIPLGRHGAGEDVAGAVAWLASEDAAYVTGQTIGVNGGVLLT
ncbi:MAG TPA: SDR family NAD(P)-dependent oxidoreductase [Actinomycetota bacterium]